MLLLVQLTCLLDNANRSLMCLIIKIIKFLFQVFSVLSFHSGLCQCPPHMLKQVQAQQIKPVVWCSKSIRLHNEQTKLQKPANIACSLLDSSKSCFIGASDE